MDQLNLARYTARRILWRLLRNHQPVPGNDICLFTSRRSGGTWLADMLTRQTGLSLVNQPLSIGLSDPYLRRSGLVPQAVIENQRVPLQGRDEPFMEDFFQRVFAGTINVEHPVAGLIRNAWMPTHRTLIKLHNMKSWIDWFGSSFPGLLVHFHVRHPVPQALSARRAGWPVRIENYLADPKLRAELDGIQIEAAMRVNRDGDGFERYLACWCLENLIPLRRIAAGVPWLVTSYEELVLEPETTLTRICRALRISSTTEMLRQVREPSRTTRGRRTRQVIRTAESDTTRADYLLDRWRDELDTRQIQEAARLLDVFRIDHYDVETPLPKLPLTARPGPEGIGIEGEGIE